MLRLALVPPLAAALVTLAAGAGAGATSDVTTLREARAVAVELFRTLDERRYARTCALLADGYFEAGAGGRRDCELGLRVGFMWAQEIHLRVTGVRARGNLAVVEALADGAPGRVVLVRVDGRYRILRIERA